MPEATVDQVKQLLGPAAVRYTDEEISRSLEEAKEFMAMKGVGSAAMPRASWSSTPFTSAVLKEVHSAI